MNAQIPTQEHIAMVQSSDAISAEEEKLVQCDFTSEEIASLLWLRQWYQTGGSDRVAVVRHLEFLKLLVVTGKMAL